MDCPLFHFGNLVVNRTFCHDPMARPRSSKETPACWQECTDRQR
uniref:Uncharacterized protein n=1 Tax=Anguilla anguilla TaxID=7936 RepID=A0A0E9TMP9_ANGAN